MRLLYIAIAVGTVLSHTSAYACEVPKPGSFWDKDQLIDQSGIIVVAELLEVVREKNHIRYLLIPIETLKGSPSATIEFPWYRSQNHADKTFSNHTDKEFWKEGSRGRSPWPCCFCGPIHTFIKGEKYLLFPDAWGAMESAEIIKSSEDKWYQYVRERIKQD